MKRFWQQTGLSADDTGWAVTLDGKPLRLPGGSLLRVQSHALADALAAEWSEAGLDGAAVEPAQLPLTGLAGAMARVATDPDASRDALRRYGETDLLCYRAERGLLAQRQQAEWQPWLHWLARCHGATLLVTAGIAHIPQPAAALAILQRVLAMQDVPALTALGVIVPALGSLVLGLAVIADTLDPAEAARLAALEELVQEEDWGTDPDQVERRRKIAGDVMAARRFLALSRESATRSDQS